MKDQSILSLLLLVALVVTPFTVVCNDGQDEYTSIIWVCPSPAADLFQLKASIEANGGRVLTLAPEGRLLVRVWEKQAASIKMIEGVEKTFAAEFARSVAPLEEDPKSMGERKLMPEDEKRIEATFTKVGAIELELLSLQRASLEGGQLSPSQVDNSLSIYFPPIRSQGGQASCTAWAACYYYNTYTQAMDENLTVSNGDNNNICSPAFMYPLVNGGEDGGAWTDILMSRLNKVGCCSWALKPYSAYDYTSWPSETAWVDALKRRTDQSFSIGNWSSGCSDAELEAIKQHLANGHVAATTTNTYPNWSYYPDDAEGINNGVMFASSGGVVGGHALTIVGYDDNKSYFDGSTTRYGAFLIANSWGRYWGVYNTGGTSKGFMWVAYDFFKLANGCFGWALYNSDRDDYRPMLYAVSGLNHTQRGYVRYRGGVGPTSSPAWYSYYPIYLDGGTSIGINDSKRVAVDLTDGIGAITYTNADLFVHMYLYPSASGDGSITSADFYHDFDGDGTYSSVSSGDPTVSVSPGSGDYASVQFTFDWGIPLNEAVDKLDWNFDTGGGANWLGQGAAFYYDDDAAQSGDISDNEESWMQTTVNESGTVTFHWKVSSQSSTSAKDYLEFYVDETLVDRISGYSNWTEKYCYVADGTHTLKWRYVKNGSISNGSDCGWVDKIEWQVNNAPDTPSLVSPANGAIGVSPIPTLQASAFSDSDGDTHVNSQWQVDDNGDFSSPEWDSGEDHSAETQTTVPFGFLSCSATYYWRVRYMDNRGAWSDWASAWSFTTRDPSIVYVDDETDPIENGSFDHPFDAIQEAINAAQSRDHVVVLDGTYRGLGNRDIDFWGKQITVRSENGPGLTTIDCESLGRAFVFHSGETVGSILDGFTIENAYSVYDGGGIYFENSSATIRNCIFRGNTASFGGAFECYNSADLKVINCLIEDNSGLYLGGGIVVVQSTVLFSNCTFSNNYVGPGGIGGGIFNYEGDVYLLNCIVWDNTPDEIYVEGPIALEADYCDIKGTVWPGTSNINIDPEFVSGDYHSYYLSHSSLQGVESPCVDAGSDTAENLGLDELSTRTDGMPDEGIVDMGYHAPYALWIDSITKSGNNIMIHWNARAGVSYVVEWCYDLEMWHGFGVGEVSEVMDYGGGLLQQVYYRVREE